MYINACDLSPSKAFCFIIEYSRISKDSVVIRQFLREPFRIVPTCVCLVHRSWGIDQSVCWGQVRYSTFPHGTIRIHCREWYFAYLKMFLVHMEQGRMNPFHTRNQLDSFYNRPGLFHPKIFLWVIGYDPNSTWWVILTWYEPAGHRRFFDPPRQ